MEDQGDISVQGTSALNTVEIIPSSRKESLDQRSTVFSSLEKTLSTNQRKSLEPGVYFRTRRAGHCGRYEPRFKPPRERLPSGKPLIQNHLPLGGYDTLEDARTVHHIAAFYYGKAEPHLDLGDGRHFTFDDPSWNEQLNLRHGKEKAKWVAGKAKEVFQAFTEAKASSGLLNASNSHTSVILSGELVANARDPSHSGFSSPAIHKSPENLASSSRATLPVASTLDEQWFAKSVLDKGDGAVHKELSGDVEYLPVSSPSPVTQDFIETTCSSLGLLENPGASFEDLTEEFEWPLENNSSCWSDFVSSIPDSVVIANGHPQYSAMNATADEQGASLLEPNGPCSPVEEVTIVKENQGSCAEAAILAKMSLDMTVVPVEVSLPDSQGFQSLQEGMDVGAPLSSPSFCSELSKEDHLFKLLSFYRQECGDGKRENSELRRENSELRREVKRLKSLPPDET